VRYWKLLNRFWGSALAAELEYRGNFALAAIAAIAMLAGSIFSLSLLYQGGYRPGGWRFEEALLVLGGFTILEGFSNTFLGPNLNRIVEQVQKGTLDFVLLKPVDSQFWLSTRFFSPWGLPNLLFGLGVWIYAGSRLGMGLSDYFLGLGLLGVASLLLYSLWFILGSTSIWFVKIYNVTEVLRGLLEAGRYPIGAYPALYRFFFTFVVPVAFLTTVPAEASLGRLERPTLLVALGIALLVFVFARFFWRLALRSYTSASS
jgi:ABC-2 type transport system permease protein